MQFSLDHQDVEKEHKLENTFIKIKCGVASVTIDMLWPSGRADVSEPGGPLFDSRRKLDVTRRQIIT